MRRDGLPYAPKVYGPWWERLDAKVDRGSDPDGCWIWGGATSRDGIPVFFTGELGAATSVRRIMWVESGRELPDDPARRTHWL